MMFCTFDVGVCVFRGGVFNITSAPLSNNIGQSFVRCQRFKNIKAAVTQPMAGELSADWLRDTISVDSRLTGWPVDTKAHASRQQLLCVGANAGVNSAVILSDKRVGRVCVNFCNPTQRFVSIIHKLNLQLRCAAHTYKYIHL